MSAPRATMAMITVDAADATMLAHWWARRFDTEAVDHSGGTGQFLAVTIPAAPTLGFQKVPDPTPGKNRLHLDLTVPDRAAGVAALVADGAAVVAEHNLADLGGADFTWTVLTDPEGNQFCVSDAAGS